MEIVLGMFVDPRRLAFAVLAFGVVYGLFLVNWIDLFAGPGQVPGYHLWLLLAMLAPFLLLTFLGPEHWKLFFSGFFLTTLMNDVFYYVVGTLFGVRVDLAEWYSCQLFGQCQAWHGNVVFDFFFVEVKPYPWLMPLTIWLRVLAVPILLWLWRRGLPCIF